MFRKIVVYFDGSPRGRKVVKSAILMAYYLKANLIIVSSLNPLDELDIGFGEVEQSIEMGLSSLAEDAREINVETDVRLLFGSPEDTLVKVIDAEKPDLVILPLVQITGGFFGRGGETLHSRIVNAYADTGLAVMVIP